MDLNLYGRVLWRFRALVMAGLALGLALSFLSFIQVSFDGGMKLKYREHEQWESLSTLWVTSRGFPWGSVADSAEAQSFDAGSTKAPTAPVDAARLTQLAGLYMQLATSDPVQRIMLREGPINGLIQTFPVYSTQSTGGDMLPMITFSAVAATPKAAHDLAGRHVDAFLNYLRSEQVQNDIPSQDRVQVDVVRQPQAPVLLQGRKMTRPIIVLMAVLIAVVALAFVLENLRPRVREVSSEAKRFAGPESASRRSA